jgi:metal-responsive CopG/Arc/MetJ family transcriptional regulator
VLHRYSPSMPKISVEVPAELLEDLDERHGRLDDA